MGYNGEGDMVEFVESWNAANGILGNTSVAQAEVIGNPASFSITQEGLVLDFT